MIGRETVNFNEYDIRRGRRFQHSSIMTLEMLEKLRVLDTLRRKKILHGPQSVLGQKGCRR